MKKINTLTLFCFLCTALFAQRRLAFNPQQHGFHFANRFATRTDLDWRTQGLCGGMVLAAFNFFRYGIPIPNLTDKDVDFQVTYHHVPGKTSGTTPLIDYIFQSQMATNFTNVSAAFFISPAHMDYNTEFNKIKSRIDRNEYTILGLKMRPGRDGMGHQVLCYGYNDAVKELYLYDPNQPDREIVLCRFNDSIRLKDGARVTDDCYRSFFEAQELFPSRISTATAYQLPDNINYSVRPPYVKDNVAKASPPASTKTFDYATSLPAASVYKFQNVATNKWMEVEDAAIAKGTKVQQYFGYERNGLCDGKNQQWLLIPAGTAGAEKVFFIFNYGFRKYLEAGSNATVQPGNDNNNQRWIIQPASTNGEYFIRNVATQRYLEMPPGLIADGDRFTLNGFTGLATQRFRFTQYAGLLAPPAAMQREALQFRTAADDGKSVNIADASTANGATVQLYDVQRGAPNSYFRLVPAGNGYYRIVSKMNDRKCLDPEGDDAANQRRLILWDVADVDKQQWLVVPVVREPGRYIFFNKQSGRCMDLAGAVPNSKAPIQTYLFVDAPNQKWRLSTE